MSYKDNIGFEKRNIVVGGRAVTELAYTTKPNYFMIYNHGGSNLYASVNHTPTTNMYDFMIPSGNAKMYAEPFGKNTLYIFNPADECRISVHSFRFDFDPVTLAMANLEIDLSGKAIEASSTISGFDCALPAGNNTIGKVILGSSSALVGKMDLKDDLRNTLDEIKQAVTEKETLFLVSGHTDVSGDFNVTCFSSSTTKEIKRIDLIRNNTDSDLSVRLFKTEGAPETFTIMEGETLTDLVICDSVKNMMIFGNANGWFEVLAHVVEV